MSVNTNKNGFSRKEKMSEFEQNIHSMFEHIWECEIDHPCFQDTIGELMTAVIQCYENLSSVQPTHTNTESSQDCVSRQAAIDAWKDDFKGYVNSLNIPRDDYNGIMEYIDELPFAQPYTDEELQKMQDMEQAELDKAFELGKQAAQEDLQPTCNNLATDCINRQAVLDVVHKSIFEFFDICDDNSEEPINEKDKLLLEVNKAICNAIKDMPSAQPEPQWIPCSERLPHGSCSDLVNVSIHDDSGDTPFDYTSCGWVTTDGEYWIVDNEINNHVVAWMPLPEPWKGGK